MNKPRLWTKDFLVVSSINFLITLTFYSLVVTIAVYAVDEFNASESQAGLVTGIFIIGTLFGRLFIGRYIDSIGRKRTLFIGLLFFTLTAILYFVNLGLTFLLINRLIHGIAMGVASTATGTIVAQTIPATRKRGRHRLLQHECNFGYCDWTIHRAIHEPAYKLSNDFYLLSWIRCHQSSNRLLPPYSGSGNTAENF